MAEKKENDKGGFWKEMAREALGGEVPPHEAEEIADAVARFAERNKGRPRRRRRYGAPCRFATEDGKRCKQRGWMGGEYCFQHDPETAELRRLAGRPRRHRGRPRTKLITVTKGQEVEELLEETLHELRAGRMKPGQAYAVGYLAQLMLAARASRLREVKLDPKWFWEMVDIAIAFDNASKNLKEKRRKAREERKVKKAKKAKKAREAESFASQSEAQDEEAEDEEGTESEENGQEAGQSGSVAGIEEEREAGPAPASLLPLGHRSG